MRTVKVDKGESIENVAKRMLSLYDAYNPYKKPVIAIFNDIELFTSSVLNTESAIIS